MSEHGATRLYAAAALAEGAAVEFDHAVAHRLRDVLRLTPGAVVAVFNERDGEWLCRIAELGRNRARIEIGQRLRPGAVEGDLWLLFAPIKRGRIDWLIEKATELGVRLLLPVWTERTQVERLNLDRLRTHAQAAAEQTGRLSVPELREPQPLARVIEGWPAGRRLVLCDETGAGAPVAEAAAGLGARPLAVLTGPEGGFAQTELDALGKLSFVTRVGLGPRVLRADTAALAALAVLQAIVGDWQRGR